MAIAAAKEVSKIGLDQRGFRIDRAGKPTDRTALKNTILSHCRGD
jgi:hypothetical protein